MKKNKVITKTWKLGEIARGGVITIEIQKLLKGALISVIGKEWDFSTGTRKSSNQSNAKEFSRISVESINDDVYRILYMELSDLVNSYYADEIIKWIGTKVDIAEQY